MARRTNLNFAESDDNDDVVYEPEVVVNDATVNARVKGTWVMHYGGKKYDFKDGNRYRLPRDLFEYLKKYGNIYDTMA